MSKNKVLSKPNVTVGSSRNAVDLSENSSITSLLGELECVYVQPFVKGSTGSINRKCFTRTASVVSPAFHRVSEHFDFFMVPLHSLWRYWENWKLNLNDMQDTNLVPYGTNAPLLDLHTYVPRMDFANIVSRLGYWNGTTSQSTNNLRKANDVLRFMDEMGYCDEFGYASQTLGSKVMNLFKLAAYQKIYFQYFRNKTYESNNPYAYNLDWLTSINTDIGNGLLDTLNDQGRYVAQQLFTRRRVNYRNDYFHNIYPGLNYVASELSGLSGFSVPSDIGQMAYSPNYVSAVAPYSTGSIGVISTLNTNNNKSVFTVQNIRAAFALDKLMRAAAFAPKKVRDQYKAQFGVDGHEYDADMECQRLGSFQSDVQFQEVVNMAETSDNALGNIGAKGLGGSDKDSPIKFHCEYDCIIMGIHYFSLRSRYDSYGVEPWNTHLTRNEFYVKAFENLGLRPFLLQNIHGVEAAPATVIGWSLPNFEYKIKPDLNHGAFKDSFLTFIDTGSDPSAPDYVGYDSSYLSTFVPHTNEVINSGGLVTADYFKVAPEDLDNVFKEKVPSDHRRSYFQFYTDYVISVPAVIPMSIHGQPTL